MSKLKRRPSSSTVIALLALFIAIGGTATAATMVIRSSKQIRPQSVQNSDIKKDNIKSNRIKNGAIKTKDLQNRLADRIGGGGGGGGNTAIDGRAVEAFRADGPRNVAEGSMVTIATLSDLPAGSYVVFGKSTVGTEPMGGLLGEGQSGAGSCTLHVTDPDSDTTDTSKAFLASPGGNSPGTMNMQITATLDEPASAFVECGAVGAEWSAANTSVIAIPVPVGPRRAVEG